jgi:hypothetical protein
MRDGMSSTKASVLFKRKATSYFAGLVFAGVLLVIILIVSSYLQTSKENRLVSTGVEVAGTPLEVDSSKTRRAYYVVYEYTVNGDDYTVNSRKRHSAPPTLTEEQLKPVFYNPENPADAVVLDNPDTNEKKDQ